MADIVIRPDVEHADIAALRDAATKMQALPDSDNRGWIYWAEGHGFNRYECWHGARTGNPPQQYPYDLFLPWHRAYLKFWEAANRAQNDAAVQPWWDWTSDLSHQQGLPASYSEVTAGNSLLTGPMPAMPGSPARRTRRNTDPPQDLPTADMIEEILDLDDFRDFSDQLQGVHGSVHGWVGGDMGIVPTAAFDPIFWAHHTMIDRIWYLWQLRHGVRNIPAVYLDKALFPGYTVQQVLDVRELGYDYATSTATSPAGPGGGAGAAPEAEEPQPEAEPEAPATEEPEDPDVQVEKETGEPVTSGPIDVSGIDSTATRADIEFDGVDHAGASYEGRVYIDNPDANAETGRDAGSGYAGSYYIFGHGRCLGEPGHCDPTAGRASFDPRGEHPLTPTKKVVVATDAVLRAAEKGGEVTITVVPIVEPLFLEDDTGYGDILHYDQVRIVTYR